MANREDASNINVNSDPEVILDSMNQTVIKSAGKGETKESPREEA